MKQFFNLSHNEKRAARLLGVTAADLTFERRTACGDLFSLQDGRVYVDGVFYGYGRRDIYRALLRKLLNRYGVTRDDVTAVEILRAYLETLRAYGVE